MYMYIRIQCHVDERVYLYYSFPSSLSSLSLPLSFLPLSLPPQAMIDVAASDGWLATTIRIMTLVQMCVQGQWVSDSSLLTLPYMGNNCIMKLNDALVQSRSLRGRGLSEITCLAEFLMAVEADKDFVGRTLGRAMPRQDLKQVGSHTLWRRPHSVSLPPLFSPSLSFLSLLSPAARCSISVAHSNGHLEVEVTRHRQTC